MGRGTGRKKIKDSKLAFLQVEYANISDKHVKAVKLLYDMLVREGYRARCAHVTDTQSDKELPLWLDLGKKGRHHVELCFLLDSQTIVFVDLMAMKIRG